MSQNCKACSHSQRAEIDQAIIEGIPYRLIAEVFDLGLATIWRHKRHLERPGTVAEQQAEQAEHKRNKTEADFGGRGFTVAEQQAEQSGTERNKAEQPAGQDNTGQAVIIEALQSRIESQERTLERQGDTIRQMLEDYGKERDNRAKERERADIIIMGLREDIKVLNGRVLALTEGKREQGKPPDTETPGKPAEPPEDTGKPEEIRFTWTDKVYFLLEDIKRILNKKIF